MLCCVCRPVVHIGGKQARKQMGHVKVDGSLGKTVWWDLLNTSILPERLADLLAAEGITPKVPVPAPGSINVWNALNRGVREWSPGKRGPNGDVVFRSEVTHTDRNTMRAMVGLHRHGRMDAKTTEWTQVAWIAFDMAAHTATVTGTNDTVEIEAANDFSDFALSMFTHLDHRWIRPNVVVHTVHNVAAGTKLKASGGVYFVTNNHMDKLERLSRVLDQIGSSSLSILTVQNDETSRKGVHRAKQNDLIHQMKGLEARLDRWQEGTHTVRSDHEESFMEEMGRLVSQADLYTDILGTRLEQFESKVKAVRLRALTIINSKYIEAPPVAGQWSPTTTPTAAEIMANAMASVGK